MRTLLAAVGLATVCLPTARAGGPQGVEFFEKHVRPVLVEQCQSCHGPKVQRGGLRLDSRAAVLKGGDSGPALVPGQADKSLLLRAVRHDGELKMPPKKKLDERSVEALSTWVRLGAPWPNTTTAAAVSPIEHVRKSHWSFRPVSRSAIPAVRGQDWPVTPIDRFILARLEAKGLLPSSPADPRILIRRVTFDLTGLPPAPEEVEAFVHDPSPGAYERLVERLLASPAYGERWGRHWLDVARYADTKGYVFQQERRFPYSYTYRDYVIAALNADLPYDRFLLHQLAADQLPGGEDRRSLAAMGFLTLGRRFLNNAQDIIDDRIDVVTRGLMGLTVSCARCHDHKFDPVPSRDYYSLHGVFASSVEPAEPPLLEPRDPKAPVSPFEKELAARQKQVDQFLAEQYTVLLTKLRAQAVDYMLAVREALRRPGERLQPMRELSRGVLTRWRDYLQEVSTSHHPVLSLFLEFARLPDAEFAARAAPLAERLAANAEPAKPINPLLARAFAGKKPAALADVAGIYRGLFEQAEKRWQADLAEARAAGKPAPVRLEDADLEAIRLVLYGDNSPTNIPVSEIDRALDRAQRNKYNALRQRVDQWRATGPGAPPRAMVLVDAARPVNPRVLVRGNPNNPGVAVPRQFLEVLATDRKPFTQGSGRLELARAIASPDNPLTTRVMVNRVWMHHFGTPLVRTPGDFGTRGEAPTHPELLDWLASEFVGEPGASATGAWSVKRLHRLIVLSAAYRQASADNPAAAAVDPENLLLWRMNRRRLEFEPLRDALLASAGRLDRRMGGPAVDITQAPFPPRRSVYGFIDRQNLPGVFRTFDLANPDSSTPQRHATTVPQQSLFLMNSPFVLDLARAFAARADVVGQKDDRGRIDRLLWLAYGRPADADELALGLAFVQSAGAKAAGLTAWEQYAQVLLLANEFAFID